MTVPANVSSRRASLEAGGVTLRSGTSEWCALGDPGNGGRWKRHREADAEPARGRETIPGKRLQPAGFARSQVRDGPRGDLGHPHTARSRFESPQSGRRVEGGSGGRSLCKLLGPSWASPFGPACGGSEIVPAISVAAEDRHGGAWQGWLRENHPSVNIRMIMRTQA